MRHVSRRKAAIGEQRRRHQRRIIERMIAELMRYPRQRHDDQLDAMSFRWIDDVWPDTPTLREGVARFLGELRQKDPRVVAVDYGRDGDLTTYVEARQRAGDDIIYVERVLTVPARSAAQPG